MFARSLTTSVLINYEPEKAYIRLERTSGVSELDSGNFWRP